MKDNIVATVLRTTDHNIFECLLGNRDLKKRPEKIIKSIQCNGYIMNPIIVNEKLQVIDGQARLEAFTRLNLPVDYIIVEGLTLEDCVALNAQATPWNLQDYINSFMALDNPNYIKLNSLAENHECGVLTIASIAGGYFGGGDKSKTFGSEAIKTGVFEISDEEYKRVNKILDFIDQFAPALKKVKGNFDHWSLALAFCYDLPKLDKRRLLDQVNSRVSDMSPCINIKTALEELENVYNFKIRADKKMYLFVEYDKMNCEKVRSYRERWSKS